MLEHLINFIIFQTITVNQTTPCFLNYTTPNMFQTCGLDKDYLTATLVGWQYITGGNFSMILVAILSLFTYIKYQKVTYPLLIGVMYLPISYFVFPATFLNYIFIMAALAVGSLIWYIFISQSNES